MLSYNKSYAWFKLKILIFIKLYVIVIFLEGCIFKRRKNELKYW